jgi:hypothetical protein
MRIMDYETNRSLNDIGVFLTIDEAEELLAYLRRLQEQPGVQRIHLSQFENSRLEKEITVAISRDLVNAA